MSHEVDCQDKSYWGSFSYVTIKLLIDALKVIQQGKDEYAMKANGLLNSMLKFSTYFGLKVSHLIFSASEQLSLNLQGKDTTTQDAVQASKLAVSLLNRQRCDDVYESFYSCIVDECEDVTDEPALPCQSRLPRQVDNGAPAHIFDSPKSYFQKQYSEVLDFISGELNTDFNRKEECQLLLWWNTVDTDF